MCASSPKGNSAGNQAKLKFLVAITSTQKSIKFVLVMVMVVAPTLIAAILINATALIDVVVKIMMMVDQR